MRLLANVGHINDIKFDPENSRAPLAYPYFVYLPITLKKENTFAVTASIKTKMSLAVWRSLHLRADCSNIELAVLRCRLLALRPLSPRATAHGAWRPDSGPHKHVSPATPATPATRPCRAPSAASASTTATLQPAAPLAAAAAPCTARGPEHGARPARVTMLAWRSGQSSQVARRIWTAARKA